MTDDPHNELHNAIDRFNQALTKAETVIRNINFGVKASVTLKPGLDLVFTKIGDRWGLGITTSSNLTPRNLMAEGSIDTRMLAGKAMPRLVKALQVARECRLLGIDELIEKTDRFTERLSAPGVDLDDLLAEYLPD